MSDRMYIAGRREFLVLLASGVAISAWALYPSTVESGIYVPLPETWTPSAADVKSAREGVLGGPVNVYTSMNAKLVSPKPTKHGLVTARYPSPVVNVSVVPLRSKLQALLMLLYSRSGDLDPAALEAKLQALLKLPDSVLAQLMEHPDLADLNKMLDAVFLGTSDMSGVKTELDKIDVTSIPGPSEQIDVIKVNGKPAYIVHSPAIQEGTENAAGSPVSAPPPPAGPVTVTVVSHVEAPAPLSASAVTVAPSSEPLSPPPAPAALSASAVSVAPSSEEFTPPPAPSSEQATPPPAPARLSASAVSVAPSSEEFTPPPEPSSEQVTPPPAPEITKSQEEPTGTPQTSLDDLNSGNKFEPGETVTDRSADDSPVTNSPATQAATPSTPATDGGSPADAGGVTGGGGITAPSNNESGGTSSNESGGTSSNESSGTSSVGGTSP